MSSVDGVTRLSDVTFCVLDLETTGTADDVDEIVEVGAVLVRGGHQLGTFQTMVRHSLAYGPSDLPTIGSVLASLLEFVRGSVIVGHNIRFDLRFLNAALWKSGHDVVLDPADAVDTVPLARRLLRDDADDCTLGTLAERFEFEQRPTHRALADAAATVELLHLLIERATHYGALDLDDLVRLPSLMRHPQRAKLAATARLPRAAGVARLVDRYGEVLHVTMADDLRHGVRSLFEQTNGTPAAVLQHLHRVDVVQTDQPIVADLAALRWTAAQTRSRRSTMTYLQLSTVRSVRLRVVVDRDAPAIVAGPLTRAVARQVVAVLAALPLEHTTLFVAALSPDSNIDVDEVATRHPILMHAIRQQRQFARARSLLGSFAVGDAALEVHDGRVLDVVTEGRSWADQLPLAVGDDRPGRPLSAAGANEAMFIAELLHPPPNLSARTG